MNYRQRIIDDNEIMVQKERQQYRDKDGWKWLNLNDKEGIRIFAECMKLDNIEEENEKLKQKCASIQKMRNEEWVRDREYRKLMGETFYESKE
jgi:hypothetical protein